MQTKTSCSCGNTTVHVVSERKTFDGATVYLHSNGEVSTRTYILRGKLPVAQMWRVWADIELYTAAELDGLLRAVRKGTWVPFRIRPAIAHEAKGGVG